MFNLNKVIGLVLLRVSSQLYEDWVVHERDWARPGFRAVAVYRFGASLHKRKRGIVSSILWRIYRSLSRFVRNHYGIELSATTIVGRRFKISHQSGIVIHPKTVFGDDCEVRQNVTIGESGLRNRHGEAPRFGNRVKIGAGAAVIGKVVIGDDVTIGPNATVMTNIPAGTTVCAPPPRLISLPNSNSQSNAPSPSTTEQDLLTSKE
jgi:serine O-acetyltransferase